MDSPTITCPTCETKIPLTEALARPYIEAERARVDDEVHQRFAAIERRENELRERGATLNEAERHLKDRAEGIESTIEERIEKERIRIGATEAKKAESRYEALLVDARRELELQAGKIAELQKTELDYRAKRMALDEEKRDLELVVARKLAEQSDDIRAEAAKEERERNQLELTTREEMLTKTRAELAKARESELEVRRAREALEEEKRAFELEVARTLDTERQRIREDTQKEDDERHRLKIAEKDKVIEQMAKQVDEFRRKVDQGSQQVQGEVLERDVRQILEDEFRDDEFKDVPSGQPGTDVIQQVKLANHSNCGSIIWESKNTKNWSDAWLTKVRKDQRDDNADLAVIVSTALPKSVDGFNRIDGVWVTARRHAVALAKALRQALIDNRLIRIVNQDRDTKADTVYAYITTKEFHRRITAVVEAYVAMREGLDVEKRVTERQWAKREKELNSLLIGTAGLYGDLQGIVGKSMPEVEALTVAAAETCAFVAELSAAVPDGSAAQSTGSPESGDQ
jgi:hypothetical protein